jgi:hypothetical protein
MKVTKIPRYFKKEMKDSPAEILMEQENTDGTGKYRWNRKKLGGAHKP